MELAIELFEPIEEVFLIPFLLSRASSIEKTNSSPLTELLPSLETSKFSSSPMTIAVNAT